MCIRDRFKPGSDFIIETEGKMQRRATSKKRAAEAEKEVDMGDKEATPVEDPEVVLPPLRGNGPQMSRNTLLQSGVQLRGLDKISLAAVIQSGRRATTINQNGRNYTRRDG